ncbi:unnamed protein product [Lota lota]
MSKGQLSTKNAKDKSNLVATRGDRDKEGRGRILVGCSSEKDSGYSDNGSDRQQTNAGVLRRGVAGHSGTKGHSEVPGQCPVQLPSQGLPHQAPHRTETNALMVPGSGNVSPIYIIQNLNLHQERSTGPRIVDKADVKPMLWTNPKGGAGGPRPGQVLLLQQTSMAPSRPPLTQPRSKSQTRMVLGTGRRKPSSFLRIAPHPSKTPPENTSPSPGLKHLSKRALCPEVKRDEPASAPSSSSLLLTSSPLRSERQTSPSFSSISSSSSSALRATKGTSPAGAARYRRFLNTMKVLKQSGLLDITLRTQELMRRSTATEHDIGQLGQHTRLLCQLARQPGAASEEPNRRTPWEKLHQAMARSGGYPSLKIPHHEPRSPGCGSDLTVSPSSSPTPSPDLNQDTAGSEPSGKVSFMPPDSSTG